MLRAGHFFSSFYYLFYILVPVAGPQFYFPAIGMDKVNACDFPAIGDYFNDNTFLLPGPGYEHGFFYNLVEASQEVGERPTAAFPQFTCGNLYDCDDYGLACEPEIGLHSVPVLCVAVLCHSVYSGALPD